jgi:hypothetical protein
MMTAHTLTEAQLKDYSIKQALAGNTAGARQTANEMVDGAYLREVWQTILFVEADRRGVQGVKETILSCPDHSLLACHSYRELPFTFVKAGDVSGAIEIATAMGDVGVLPLIGIAVHLAGKGDFMGMRDALSHIDDEGLRTLVMNNVQDYQSKDMSHA